MSTPDQDYENSFNEDLPKTEVSEDQAFGIEPESPQEDAQEGAEEPGEQPADAAESATENNEPEAEPAVVEADAAASGDVAAEPVDDKDEQRLKSWEGRLKSWEADLKSRAESMKKTDPQEASEDPAEEATETPVAEAVEQAAEAIQSGDMSFEQAMQSLSNDFGPDFTKMLSVLVTAKAKEIAGQVADEKTSAVRGELDGVVSELVSDKERAHFESISAAHPDFEEVAGSAEFKSYIDGLPASEHEKAMQVIGKGSAKQIVQLIDSFKQSGGPAESTDKEEPAQDKPDESKLNDAEGVRSSTIKIPEQPAKADDYEAAWDSF